MPILQEAEPLARQREIGILSLGRVGNSGWILQNNSDEPECVGRGARALVLRAKQEWTLPDKMYGDSSSLQLPAVLEGFLANAVPCCECGHITGQAGGCVGKVGARNRLPPPQQITWPAACSWPFARDTLGQESSQKVGDVSYSVSVTLPWLAGTPRDL